jgi:hypothetical protein
MQLGVSMTVRQTPEQVWEFLAFPPNAARWDRSVAEVIPQTDGPVGEGYEAITVSPGGMLRLTSRRALARDFTYLATALADAYPQPEPTA